MFLSLAPATADSPASAVSFQVNHVAFGALPSRSIALLELPTHHDNPGLQAIADGRSTPQDAEKCLVLVAFQFGIPQDGRAAAMTTYIEARAPALERHGGRVYLSAISERKGDWNYDGFEILEFLRPDSVQALMGDEDYRARTKQAGAVFAGDFAMGLIASH